MQRLIVRTGDGSASVYMPGLDEHYHSIHGAVQESRHVFIDAGLAVIAKRQSAVTILEVGFGTALNAYLSYRYAVEHHVQLIYHGIEPFPLSREITSALNYPEQLGHPEDLVIFEQLHAAPWSENALVLPDFHVHKYAGTLQETELQIIADLVYFDAFAPRVQPELWEQSVFEKLYGFMKPGGILVTYCAKGEVKRRLRSAGFSVESLPGPPGKREMTRAIK